MKKKEKAKLNGQNIQKQSAPNQQPPQQRQVTINDVAMAINKNVMMMADSIERLGMENAQLKQQVEKLQQEIERLKEKTKKK